MPGMLFIARGGGHFDKNIVVGESEVFVNRCRIDPTWQNGAEECSEVEIQRAARSMEIELFEHEVARELQTFGCMHSAAFDSDRRLTGSRRKKHAKRVDQAMVIEVAVHDTGVKRVAKQVIGAVGPEGVAGDDLREKLMPWREFIGIARPVLQADGDFRDIPIDVMVD